MDRTPLDEHEDESPWSDRGLPDPHRHNPFAVGLALVVMVTAAYVGCAVVVLSLIAGWRP